MDIRFVPMTAEYARIAAGWRYPGALREYDQPSAQGYMIPAYFAAVDADRAMIGFACLGEDARLSEYAYPVDAVDIGLGMRPDLVGQGLGCAYVHAVISLARGEHPGLDVRLTVAEWNGAAIAVYTKVGFVREGAFHRTDGVAFMVMRLRGAGAPVALADKKEAE